ncbi:MAG: acyl carrier protein [bacterium]
MSDVFEFVKDLLVENMQVDESKISREANIIEDLGADSLDIMDIVNDIEKEYDITIPQEEYENLRTVGDVIDFVEKQK